MRKTAWMVILALFLVPALASQALAWGSATHAYIMEQVSTAVYQLRMQEVYGAMVPDLFNYLFGVPFQGWLHDTAHATWAPPDDSGIMALWARAEEADQKAVAAGFAGHNNLWGADSTAHNLGIPGAVYPNGYVIQKALMLDGFIYPTPGDLGDFYRSIPDATRWEICHNIVEAAGDILVMGWDPTIGGRIQAAAMSRIPEFPSMLARAYARGLADLTGGQYSWAQKLIRNLEGEFRMMMVGYGAALSQDQATAIYLLAQDMARLAEAYLGELPPGIGQEEITAFIQEAMIACIYSGLLADYQAQIDATIAFVAAQLPAHGIVY